MEDMLTVETPHLKHRAVSHLPLRRCGAEGPLAEVLLHKHVAAWLRVAQASDKTSLVYNNPFWNLGRRPGSILVPGEPPRRRELLLWSCLHSSPDIACPWQNVKEPSQEIREVEPQACITPVSTKSKMSRVRPVHFEHLHDYFSNRKRPKSYPVSNKTTNTWVGAPLSDVPQFSVCSSCITSHRAE